MSIIDEKLNTIYVVSVTFQTMPGAPEPLCECNDEILLHHQMISKLDWISENRDDESCYNQNDALEHYEDSVLEDEENYNAIDFDALIQSAYNGDLKAISAVLNGDANKLGDYRVTTLLNILC